MDNNSKTKDFSNRYPYANEPLELMLKVKKCQS